jgi:hypothetical protein
VVPINSLQLTITLYSSVITTLFYNDTKYSVPFMTLEPSSTIYHAYVISLDKTFEILDPDIVKFIYCIR